jgi:hypothetical protein
MGNQREDEVAKMRPKNNVMIVPLEKALEKPLGPAP